MQSHGHSTPQCALPDSPGQEERVGEGKGRSDQCSQCRKTDCACRKDSKVECISRYFLMSILLLTSHYFITYSRNHLLARQCVCLPCEVLVFKYHVLLVYSSYTHTRGLGIMKAARRLCWPETLQNNQLTSERGAMETLPAVLFVS